MPDCYQNVNVKNGTGMQWRHLVVSDLPSSVVERRSSPVVGRSLCTPAARVQFPGWEARIIWCKNLALYIRDCESLSFG